jgi:vacuolar-type H+-ATPase subunit I/STV1
MPRWTDSEESYLLEKVKEGMEKGVTALDVLRLLDGDKNLGGRGEEALSQKYYHLVRQAKAPIEVKGCIGTVDKPAFSSDVLAVAQKLVELEFDMDVLDAFEGLPEYIQDMNQRMEALKREVEQAKEVEMKFDMGVFLGELGRLYEKVGHVSRLEAQRDGLIAQVKELRNIVQEYEAKFLRIKGDYKEACAWFSVFMESSSIRQMMSMGEIKTNMKTTLDKWGTVLKVEFEEVG